MRASEDLARFVETNALATAASFRCQDRLDNTHPCYAGDLGLGIDPALAERVREADLLLVIGARLGEMTTRGYRLRRSAMPAAEARARPSRSRRTRPGLPADPGGSAPARPSSCAPPRRCRRWNRTPGAIPPPAPTTTIWHPSSPPPGFPGRWRWARSWRTCASGSRRKRSSLPTPATSPRGCTATTSTAGFPSQIGPTSGAMGYGIPAAIAARHVYPDRPVIAFCGDGGALMTGQEIATAVHHGIDPVILVVNNSMLGTIRMHQERDYPDRVIATGLTNPDFVAWAESFGAFAARGGVHQRVPRRVRGVRCPPGAWPSSSCGSTRN